MVKIYDTDTVADIATKIFEKFDVHNSVTIFGFLLDESTEHLAPKGELVWNELEKMDFNLNCRMSQDAKKLRNYKWAKDSIGGPIAHKIFRKDVKIIDNQPRWTIWRTQ